MHLRYSCVNCDILISIFKKFYLFIQKGPVSQRRRGREKENVFYLLVHSPNDHSSQGCTGLKSEAQSSWAFRVGAGAKALGHPPQPSQAHSQELGQKWSIEDMNPQPYGCWRLTRHSSGTVIIKFWKRLF